MDKFKDDQLILQKHSEKSVSRLITGLKELDHPVNKADMLLSTGLTLHVLEDSLETLIERYQCRLQVNDEGEILYNFDFRSVEKPKKSFWQKAKEKLKIFSKKGFKAWITFMMLGYFWFYFPIIPISLVSTGFYAIAILSAIVLLVLFPALFIYTLGHTTITSLFFKKQKKKNSKFSLKKLFNGSRNFFTPKSKVSGNFITSTFRYVFGEKQNKIDNLSLEKQILSYIYHHNQQITVSELISLTGWSIKRAEEEMTKLLVNYDGTVNVDPDGVIIYTFPHLTQPALAYQPEKPFIWQNLLKLWSWNKNFTYKNALITGFNLFILAISGAMWGMGIQIPEDLLPNMFSFLNAHWFPFLYSALLLGSSIRNKINFERTITREKEKSNEYFRLLHRVFENPEGIILDRNHPHYQKLIEELEGEEDVDADGNVIIRFPYLLRERSFAQNHQQLNYAIQEEEITHFWEFQDDFYEKNIEKFNENILVAENGNTLTVYFKLIPKNALLKVFSYGMLLFFFLMLSIGAINIGLAVMNIFLVIPYFFLGNGLIKSLRRLMNTITLKLSPDKMEIYELPFKWFSLNKTYSFEDIDHFRVYKTPENSYRLNLKLKSKKFPIVIIDNINDNMMLLELEKRLNTCLGLTYE